MSIERPHLDGSCVPAAVLDVDVFDGTVHRRHDDPSGQSNAAWALVRFDGEPIGRLLLEVDPVDSDVLALAERRFAAEVSAQRSVVSATGQSAARGRRERAAARGENITAVVCTIGSRRSALERCMRSLQSQSYQRASFLIVDNSPDQKALEVFELFAGDDRFRYVSEGEPGLASARNASVRATDTPLIAWIDDDEVADQYWLHEHVAGYVEVPDAAVVCGYMAPAELRTKAQVWFEQWGGHSKGRTFREEIFRKGGSHNPLYPLPAFGTGGNMSYRRRAIEAIGCFDPALGAGTPAMGSEDTRAFADSMLRGDTLVFHPSAISFHYHRDDESGLLAQLRGYGVGLTAFYTSLVLRQPAHLFGIGKLAPVALKDLKGGDSVRNASLPPDFPPSFMTANRRGMLLGPFAYMRGRAAHLSYSRSRRRSTSFS